MSVRQGANAIVQNITFIIKRIEACFIDFYGPQDVIHKLEGTEGARSMFTSINCLSDSATADSAKIDSAKTRLVIKTLTQAKRLVFVYSTFPL